MVDQTPTVLKSDVGIIGYYTVLSVVVSTGDSFTVRDITQVQGVVGMKIADWSPLDFTYTGNTVTVTTSGLNKTPIIVTVGGLK